jgi:hypothetical protein
MQGAFAAGAPDLGDRSFTSSDKKTRSETKNNEKQHRYEPSHPVNQENSKNDGIHLSAISISPIQLVQFKQ